MKKIILFSLGIMLSIHGAQAEERSLECTSGQSYEVFSATLDDSSYDAGSGYFNVRRGRLTDNYANAELICTGHTLQDITCVGFLFGSPNQIVKVFLQKKDDIFQAVHKQIEGRPVFNTSPWDCTVK